MPVSIRRDIDFTRVVSQTVSGDVSLNGQISACHRRIAEQEAQEPK